MAAIHDNWHNQPQGPFEIAKYIFCLLAETVIIATHYLIYLEAFQLPDVTYLSEVPPFNMVLGPDSELSLKHIISGLFALTSVLAPIMIWDMILTERLPEELRAFLGSLRGQIKAILLPLLYLIVIALEVAAFNVFISKMIDEMGHTGFTTDIEDAEKYIELAIQHGETFTALGTTVLILINAMIAWITAKIHFSMKTTNDGGLL